jgi:hypothetical protein
MSTTTFETIAMDHLATTVGGAESSPTPIRPMPPPPGWLEDTFAHLRKFVREAVENLPGP